MRFPIINLPTIVAATDNFSHTNKIGEGGFGPVCKVSFSAPFSSQLGLHSLI